MLLALIKKLLKRSFVIYRLAGGHPFQGQEMEDEINPLAEVIPDFEYPWAAFDDKHPFVGIAQTYHVLVGNHYDLRLSGKGRKGPLDGLIFPLIARILIGRLGFDPRIPFLLRFVFIFVGSLLEIPRHVLGIVLTVVLIPVVFLVHGFAYYKRRGYEKTSDSVQYIKLVKVLGTTPEGEPLVTLQESPISSNDINVRANMRPTTIPCEKGKGLTGFEVSRALGGTHENNARFFLPLKSANREGIIALLAMNMGSILENLKRAPSLFDEVQQWIKQPPTRPLQNAFLMGTSKSRPGKENRSPIHGLVHSSGFDKNLIAMILEMADLTEKRLVAPEEATSSAGISI